LAAHDLRSSRKHLFYGPDAYDPDFNGTSSAIPIVAGIADRVLSATSALTEAEVREILMTTADKVGGRP